MRAKEINEFCFDLINTSGDKEVSIIDLVDMCSNFLPDTPFGTEVNQMLNTYTTKNLRPRFNPRKLQFDLHHFLKAFGGEPCLAKEMDRIFCGQFVHPQTQATIIPAGFKGCPKAALADPIAKLTVVFDEQHAPQTYFD